ncbi:MAG: type II toxin-antitoxin system RelE/ParE family toxin [Polyangiaceae bacterium]
MKVEFAGPAREQIREAAAWWRENRPAAPHLFEEELAFAVAMLEAGPLLTRVFDEVEGKVVRRARLPRTRYALYFTVGDDLVTVHALWHTSRGSGPPLR